MYKDELYRRQMGFSYDPDRLHSELANGVVGYDGELDRSNGFEEDLDSGELPYRLFDEMGEAGEKAAEYMQLKVEDDVAAFGVEQMSDIDFALDRALIAYGVELADTPVPLEVSVAEYFGTLANVILDSRQLSMTDEQVEELFTDIANHLTTLDQHVADELAVAA